MTSLARLSRMITTLALLAVGAVAVIAHAAEPAYPTRSIRLVIGFPPGGALDVLARHISPKLSDAMGQVWVVENRAGAGGNLSSEIVARANPDGHTVLLALNTQLTASPSLYKLPFSVEKDLQPLTMVAVFEHILVVHPGVPARTLQEFVALAKQAWEVTGKPLVLRGRTADAVKSAGVAVMGSHSLLCAPDAAAAEALWPVAKENEHALNLRIMEAQHRRIKPGTSVGGVASSLEKLAKHVENIATIMGGKVE